MSNPEQFRAETAIGLVKPFHRVECRCEACIAWLQIELCKQWAEVWRLKAKASDLETENQTLLVRLENREAEIKRLQAIVGGLELQLLESTDARLQNQAIVDKLPKTVDSVPVVPGMILWDRNFDTFPVEWVSLHREGMRDGKFYQWSGEVVMENCYSSQEAAEAAAKESEVGR